MSTYGSSMEENRDYKILLERVILLENRYSQLVDEYINFHCMCNKPMEFHQFKDIDDLKNELLERIKE